MGGGTSEIHSDTDYLATGTHQGSEGETLSSPGAMFDVFVAQTGLYIVNTTTGEEGQIASIAGDTILATSGTGSGLLAFDEEILTFDTDELTFGDGTTIYMTWNPGDRYEIYKTVAKNTLLSKTWVDLSAGVQASPQSLVQGWRPADRDLNVTAGGGTVMVFGPGQPE